jgi:hypothetical protein
VRYPSDLTDDEWKLVEPLIPPGKRGGGKRTVVMREVVNGIVLAPTAVALSLQRRPDFHLDGSYHPTVVGTYLCAAVLASLFKGASSRLMRHPHLFASSLVAK